MRSIGVILAVVGILLSGTLLIDIAYSYSGSTDNTGNTVSTEFVVLYQSDYSFTNGQSGFGYDQVVKKYGGYTFTATSQNDAARVTISITDRSTIPVGTPVNLWITNTETKQYSGMKLIATNVANENPVFEPTLSTTNSSFQIGVGTGSGAYSFTVSISGMSCAQSSHISVSMSIPSYAVRASEQITINDTQYRGISAGNDTLRAERSTGSDMVAIVLSSTGFTDMQGKEWLYVVKLTYDMNTNGGLSGNDWDTSPQYAYTDGHGTWSYSGSSCLKLTPDKNYITELYLAGPASGLYAISAYPPSGSNGKLIENGTISFMFDSTQ